MYQFMMASASPRRRELIENLGRSCICIAVDADETMDSSLTPDEAVVGVAVRKAQAAAQYPASKDRLIIAADTIVVLGDKIYGKPADKEEARTMLRELSGKEHSVLTGVCLITPKGNTISFYERTGVVFRQLSNSEIDAYIATGEPMDKAGAYGIQTPHGSLFISGINGDYYNVVGLPVCRLYSEITRLESLGL